MRQATTKKNITRSIKAIRASESKHQKTEEEDREAGRNPLIESLYHSGLVCLWVCVCVCMKTGGATGTNTLRA